MDHPTWIGRSLNARYKINAMLGQGGMSAVYKAHDPNLKRVVAIKLIHPHLSTDPDFVYRFKKEASSVAAFRHPNIVQVYDFNEDDGVYYMVMEFIPGETLQERLKELRRSNSKMPIEQAIQVVINVCEAMGYAHKHGMIHRDIKPANIMLDVHGQAILMDFGIVKIVDDETHTVTGAVVGTARYMSPEVIRSEAPDERSDIYSLGVTFFEMLSGSPPFNADSAMSLMMRHLNDPVPDLRNLRTEVPPELATIITKSLEKDKAKRYRTADEMAADLKRLASRFVAPPLPLPVPEDVTAVDPGPFPLPAASAAELTGAASLSTQAEPALDPPTIVDDMPAAIEEVATVTEPASAVSASIAMSERVPDMQEARHSSPLLMFGGGGLLILLILAGWFLLNNRQAAAISPMATATRTVTLTSAPTETQAAVALIADTESPTATRTPTQAPTMTNTLPPLYVRINDITVDENDTYIVEYETFGYTEVLPGQHIHFFFDTVPPDRAGSPASGPWYLWGGPRPFDKYRVSDRPEGATQMCVLVANSNHSVIPETGNCFDLP